MSDRTFHIRIVDEENKPMARYSVDIEYKDGIAIGTQAEETDADGWVKFTIPYQMVYSVGCYCHGMQKDLQILEDGTFEIKDGDRLSFTVTAEMRG
jgi:hypothetical protein